MSGVIHNTPSPSPTESCIVMEINSSPRNAANVAKSRSDAPRAGKDNTTCCLRHSSSPCADLQKDGRANGLQRIMNMPQHAVKDSTNASDAALLKVAYAARTCVRADYLQFLKANLPHWVRDGIWHTIWSPNQTADVKGYENLQKAYWHVCRLDRQMKDDAIRSRMAMLLLYLEYENTHLRWKTNIEGGQKPATKVGRGNISSLIDNIIENTHPEWSTADSQEKSKLRANFHDRKRYGKRWWMLVDPLGPGILILCSPKFAGMMYDLSSPSNIPNNWKLY